MAKIAPSDQDEVIFLGDYIDRGPESRGVVDYLLTLPSRYKFLMGNHEKMLLDFLEGRGEELYLYNGGGATLRNYGGPSQIPASHLAFFRSLVPYYETPEYLFVHAGIRPMVPLAQQDPEDLVWIRDEFFRFVGRFERPVVFGHTPLREVMMRPDRIGIDTGCVYGGKLTCLLLPSRDLVQVRAERAYLSDEP